MVSKNKCTNEQCQRELLCEYTAPDYTAECTFRLAHDRMHGITANGKHFVNNDIIKSQQIYTCT